MTDLRRIDPAAEKLFEATLKRVQGKFEIKRKEPETGLKLLARFDELKNYRSLFVHKVTEFKGTTGSFTVLLAEKHLTIIQQKRTARVEKEVEEIEPVLIFNIPHDIGKVLIRKEAVADKLVDIFIKVDIDFEEYPDFSKNYYVVGENPDLVKQFFPKKLIESLDGREDVTIEIHGNRGLLRTGKNLTGDVLLLLLSIGYRMTRE
jgi:hypothetical protein